MPLTSRSLSNVGLMTTVFIGSGIFLLGVYWFFFDPPVNRDALRQLNGTVAEVLDTKHYKEPAHTVSFDLTIAGQDGGTTVLQIVKQAIAPDVVRGLVNRPITAAHDGTLIYELSSEGSTLFSYADVAAMVERDRNAARWAGYTCVAIGLMLAAWGRFTGRRMLN